MAARVTIASSFASAAARWARLSLFIPGSLSAAQFV